MVLGVAGRIHEDEGSAVAHVHSEAVTRGDVLRVAREHVHPDGMTIVAVGKTGEFRKSLATLGLPVSSIDLTIPKSGGESKKP